jgi:hypothetical protein
MREAPKGPPDDIFIHRAATIIDRNSLISSWPSEEDTFVVCNGQIAIGGSRITHASVALNNNLHYQLTERSDSPIVDDGGQIYDDGNELVIGSYFTSSTTPKLIVEARRDENIDMAEVKKQIRKNTGQLFANITGRTVVVKHKDNTEDKFFPQS